jgi:plasmid stabilization system protein ParE
VIRFTVEILTEAEAEFREAFLWYFERSPVFADAFRTEVLSRVDELQEDADSWPKDEDGIHYRILAKRFKTTIHYDLVGAVATVLAIAPQLREPGYWSGRRGSKAGSSEASNPSLERRPSTAGCLARGTAKVHHRFRGQGSHPLQEPQLELQGLPQLSSE